MPHIFHRTTQAGSKPRHLSHCREGGEWKGWCSPNTSKLSHQIYENLRGHLASSRMSQSGRGWGGEGVRTGGPCWPCSHAPK